MKKVFHYLKSYAWILILCILLLFGQAMADLSLPNLMSNIVNVGIQQSGIEEKAPRALSENGMKLMTLFMSSEDKQTFLKSYTLTEKGSTEGESKKGEFPLLEKENAYLLTDEAAAGEIYAKSGYAMMLFAQDMAKKQGGTQAEGETSSSSATLNVTEIYTLLPMLEKMPAETFATYIDTASKADASMTAQVGTALTKGFYEEDGIDTNAMQNAYIYKTGGLMLLITILGVIATISVGFFAARVAAAVARRMRRDVFAKVESFGANEFDTFSTASLITRTTNDITQIQMLIVIGIRMICYAPIMGIGGIIMAVGKSVNLSWIIAIAVLVLIGVILVIFSIALPKFKAVQKLIDKLNLVTRENLSGMMVIRAFGNEQYEEGRFEKANDDLTRTNLFVNRVMVSLMPFMMFLMNAMSLAVVWVGGHQIAESAMQVGDMMAFMQYGMQIIMAFLMIAMLFIMIPRAAVSAARVAEVLNVKPSILDRKEPAHLAENTPGEVAFRGVSFRYDKAEGDVLTDISFTAKPGETTAFIGSTGSGKSTLINLITRFYDVTKGEITVDGVDIRDLPQKELRDLVGYVPQKGVLFSGDITSNIRYGKEDANDEQIAAAAETAQAIEFINNTEHGFETDISQGGTNVSGGQKQRLSIARALVKKAPIYIFDDSFSALDFKTDAALRRALHTYTGASTVLIVAQRISTIMSAEQIIVLDEGRIVGIGTHKELLQNCSVYREIAESQLSQEELQ